MHHRDRCLKRTFSLFSFHIDLALSRKNNLVLCDPLHVRRKASRNIEHREYQMILSLRDHMIEMDPAKGHAWKDPWAQRD